MGAGGAEIYNPAGAEGAGEKGGAAVVAQGGHSFASVAAVIKVYFLLKASCVFAPSPLGGAGLGAPPGARRLGLQVVVMGRNWAASEGGPRPGRAAPRRARREAMRCCRFCRFGNWDPCGLVFLHPPSTGPTTSG